MRKNGFFFLCLLPIIACAQMNITTNERASKELMPDVLQTHFSFEEESKDANVIKEHLNALVAEVKRFDSKGEVCRGGGYYLSPRYSYKDQKQLFMGYSGSLSFTCELNTIEQYNVLMKKLDEHKAPNVRVNLGALAWSVSNKAQNAALLSLRSEVLRIAQTQAQNFSNETKMQCNVSAVSFEGTQPIRPVFMENMRAKAAIKAESVPMEEPLQRNETLSLNATVNYTCLNAK